MLTQQVKDFLTLDRLMSLDIWVDFGNYEFLIKQDIGFYNLYEYIALQLNKVQTIPYISHLYNRLESELPSYLIRLSDTEKMIERLSLDTERSTLDIGYDEKHYIHLKEQILGQAIVKAFNYIYWDGTLCNIKIIEGYEITADAQSLLPGGLYSEIDIITFDDDYIDNFPTASIVTDHCIWKDFNYSEEELNKALNNISDFEKATQIEQITTLLNLYYPEKYDLNIIDKKIILHWDKVDIRNSEGSSHTMYDFYIKLDFNNNFNKITEMRGLRASFVLKEYWNANPYTFSHLGTGKFGEWSYLCLGSTSLSEMYGILQTSEFSLIVFEAFLLQLNEYVKWESLEGGPFRGSNIGKIAYKNTDIVTSNYRINYITDEIISNILSRIYPIVEIDISTESNQLFIVETPLLEKAIHQVCIKTNCLVLVVNNSVFEKYKDFTTGETFWEQELLVDSDKIKAQYFIEKKNVENSNSNLFSFRGNQVRRKLLPEHFEDESIAIPSNRTSLPKVLVTILYTEIIRRINDKLLTLTIKKINEQYITNKQRELVTS